jgi:hypothetical protein
MLQAVLDKSTGQLMLMEMCHLLINPKYKELWGKAYTKELARLAQGIPGISKGTKTVIFIKRKEIPADCRCDATYTRVCVNYRPEKEVGGNLIHFLGNVSTPTIEMVTIKLHLNSVISTKGACYCTINLKDFFLNIPMARLKYMHMNLKDIPPKFVKIYYFKKNGSQRYYLHQDPEGHVWPPTIRRPHMINSNHNGYWIVVMFM